MRGDNYPDRIFHNGQIPVMDEEFSIEQAVAVRGGSDILTADPMTISQIPVLMTVLGGDIIYSKDFV